MKRCIEDKSKVKVTIRSEVKIVFQQQLKKLLKQIKLNFTER